MKLSTATLTAYRRSFSILVSENFAVLAVIVGYLLLAISIGPFTNSDTTLEYGAVSGILKSGLPYTQGSLINQPPLGFYIQALFAKIFGFSMINGVFINTLFGAGCILILYEIGKNAYNKTTGVLAALFLAFSPWHMIFSRIYLIDIQCLFFSLLFVLYSIKYVKFSKTFWLVLASLSFAAAFSIKIYAIFAAIPLLILYFSKKPIKMKKTLFNAAILLIPVISFSLIWYQFIAKTGLFSVLSHWDLSAPNVTQVTPQISFVLNFLVNYGVGWFFLDAVILSLIVYLIWRRSFNGQYFFDLICLVVVVAVVGINTFLGAYLNLYAPFLNAIKYDYQALPFLCLLAASLVPKLIYLLRRANVLKKARITNYFLIVTGFGLIAFSLIYNERYLLSMHDWTYFIFRVEPHVDVGYAVYYSGNLVGYAPLLIGAFGVLAAILGVIWHFRIAIRKTLIYVNNKIH